MSRPRGARGGTPVLVQYDERGRVPGSKLDFDSTVEHPAFGVCIDLAESRVLMRRENYAAVAALPNVGNIFGIEKQAEFAERFFSEKSEHAERFCARAVA